MVVTFMGPGKAKRSRVLKSSYGGNGRGHVTKGGGQSRGYLTPQLVNLNYVLISAYFINS